jgi:hypothetical protein
MDVNSLRVTAAHERRDRVPGFDVAVTEDAATGANAASIVRLVRHA